MKFLLLVLIITQFCHILTEKDIQAVSTALLNVIDVYFVRNHILFVIIDLTDQNSNSSKIIETVLSQSAGNFSYELKADSKFSENPKYLETSTIFFVDTCLDIGYINHNFALENHFSKPLKFLVYSHYCLDFDLFQEFQSIVKQQKMKIYDSGIESFEYIPVNSEQVLPLYTIDWFTTFRCNAPKLTRLNSFSKSSGNWSRELISHEKFKNFGNCQLVMLLPVSNSIWGQITIKNNVAIHTGLIPTIFQIISKKYNYRPYYQPGYPGSKGSLLSNIGKIDKYLVAVKNKKYIPQVLFDMVQIASLNALKVHVTATFYNIKHIILVTPGELYSPYEKLLLPFDRMTWTFLIITFIGAFTSILIVNRLPKLVQHILYGQNNQTPSLNVMRIFFGLSLEKLPKKTFARFVLTMFVLFCVVFRTCYQSKMFDFLTSEQRKEPPKSIEDLIKNNYTMYVSEFSNHLKNLISHEKEQW